MLNHLGLAVSIAPAMLNLVTATHVDLEVVLQLVSQVEDKGGLLTKQIATNPHIQRIAHAPALADFPSVEVLRTYPDDTVGRALAHMLDAQGFDPIDTDLPDTPEGRVQRWLNRTHDLFHVATGFGTDDIGEAGLQAFYLAQFHGGLQLVLLAGLHLRLLKEAPQRINDVLDAVTTGWQLGRSTAMHMSEVDWHRALTLPVDDFRDELGITAVTGIYSAGRYAEEVAKLPERQTLLARIRSALAA